jgi:TRAP-type C4-dicarboxylate transport system permease small subunit
MRILQLITRYMAYGSAAALFFLMMLTVVHVSGRSFFHSPVKGAIEISAYVLLLIVTLGWCSAALGQGHIKVDLVVDRLPKRARFIITNITLILSFIILAFATWANGIAAMGDPRYTSVLKIPDIPFKWVMTVGFGMFCICTLVVIIENLRKRGKDGN